MSSHLSHGRDQAVQARKRVSMTCRVMLLVAVTILIGTALANRVRAAPATQFGGFLCEINLADRLSPLPSGVPGSVFTNSSTKLCTGTSSSQNVKITCVATVPNWPAGSTVSPTKVPCTLNVGQCAGCAGKGLLSATNSNLTIDASGHAQLICQFQPKKGCTPP